MTDIVRRETAAGSPDGLYALANLIHAIARRLPPPSGLKPGRCTPKEIEVMRFIGSNPGSSAGITAAATGLPTSNFSRVLKGLVEKGLVRREPDDNDARLTHLFPTELAGENWQVMRDAWSHALKGALDNPSQIDALVEALGRIDRHLARKLASKAS